MKHFYFVYLLVWFHTCQSQLLRASVPVAYSTIGTYSRHFADVFSFTNNQASLAQVKNISAGVYSEKRFLLDDLRTFSAVISAPCFDGAAGVAADYTGFSDFSQSHLGLAYGRSLSSKVDLGVQINYDRIGLAGYGNSSALNFEIGTIFHLTEKLHAGCHVYNPVGGKFGKTHEEKLSSVYSFGMGYEASEKLFLGSEIIRQENQPVECNVVMHYAFEKQFFVRAGVSSSVANYFAGVGIMWKNTRLDLAADWHPQAGLTPSLLFVFLLSKPKPDKE